MRATVRKAWGKSRISLAFSAVSVADVAALGCEPDHHSDFASSMPHTPRKGDRANRCSVDALPCGASAKTHFLLDRDEPPLLASASHKVETKITQIALMRQNANDRVP